MAVTVPAWEVDDLTDYRALIRARLAHVVPVGEPLVLISQIQRSGGTLLLQLLDGHRQCHVDPYELKIGHPKKHNWPPLDLSRPETWFETLYFRGIVERIRRTERTTPPGRGPRRLPVPLLPRLQKQVFDASAAGAGSEREVLDAYFTSYFNAWLDNHDLYTGAPKRAVVGFTPRLAMDPANVELLLRRVPRGDADLDRPRPARLVRVGGRAHGRALRRRGRRPRALERLDRRDDRRRRALRRARARSHLRATGARSRVDDAPGRRAASGSTGRRRFFGRHSTAARSARTRATRRCRARGSCPSGRLRARFSDDPRRIAELAGDRYERAAAST